MRDGRAGLGHPRGGGWGWPGKVCVEGGVELRLDASANYLETGKTKWEPRESVTPTSILEILPTT